MKVLLIGDIVGNGGRAAIKGLVPELMQKYDCDFCIANGENMAGGNGFTLDCLEELAPSGIDVFTGGDHSWDQKDFIKEINSIDNVLRPANLSSCQPGRGYGIFTGRSGHKYGVISLLGRTFIGLQSNCPFEAVDGIVNELRKETPFIFVDFHAEATSEKISMARFLDGRVSAVAGTHTHVQTADERVLPGGTAFICDLGMVGSRESILGRDITAVVSKFVTGMPVRFPVVTSFITLNGAVVTLNEDGKAAGIERISVDFS